MNENESQVILYDNPIDGKTVEVKFVGETVWLSQKQMAELFNKDTDTIGLHLKNIYDEDELTEESTTEFFSVVQKEGSRNVKRDIRYYNLDAIISVGYRVNSKRGTIFRKWATQRLKEYLVKGYTINEKRLLEVRNHFNQLEKTLQFIKSKTELTDLSISEAKGLIDVIMAYTHSLIVLSRYDSGSLEVGQTNKNFSYEIKYEEALEAIQQLKEVLKKKQAATDLFGNPKDDSFKGILGNIVQTFDGQYLYASIEEQAAHLLYFIIKDHPFNDGNKRIGAFLFVWFLDKNKYLMSKNGTLKINENALVAMALLVAQSDPADMELMIKLIINLINQE